MGPSGRITWHWLYGAEELSEQLGVTKSHLVRTFKQEIGVSPGKYHLTNVRIGGREGTAF